MYTPHEGAINQLAFVRIIVWTGEFALKHCTYSYTHKFSVFEIKAKTHPPSMLQSQYDND